MGVTVKKHALPRSYEIRADVGILERGGGKAADKHGDELTIAALASYHEFGLGVPQRSFIRGFFDAGRPRANGIIEGRLKAIRAGTVSPATGAEQIGIMLAGACAARVMRSGALAPLAAETISRKGSARPLVDTGLLVSAITGTGRVVPL